MATLGDILRDTMRDRIQNGINANDSPAKQLSPGYAAAKQRKGLNPFRDWTNSGNTVRAMVTLSADENKATIGFNNPVAGRVAHFNNLRERAFGVSSADRRVIGAAVVATARQAKVVTTKTDSRPVQNLPRASYTNDSGQTVYARW